MLLAVSMTKVTEAELSLRMFRNINISLLLAYIVSCILPMKLSYDLMYVIRTLLYFVAIGISDTNNFTVRK